MPNLIKINYKLTTNAHSYFKINIQYLVDTNYNMLIKLTRQLFSAQSFFSSDKDYATNNNDEADFEDLGNMDEETEHHLVKLFRRISQPFKKATKNVGKKFDRAVSDVTYLLRDAASDIDRKFNDFFNMTMEMFEHQHHQLESYETSLSGLKQCCSGTTSDLSDFKARSVPTFDRLDAFLARNLQDQSTERCRQQIRFDADRIMAAVKDQV